MKRIMSNTLQASLLTAAVLSLANIAHASTTASVTLTATISGADSISCSSSVDLNAGANITSTGVTTSPQTVTCSVSNNETDGVTETAYMTTPLTSSANTIASTNISWSATFGGTYAPFAALTSGVGNGDTGAVINTDIASGSGTAANFYLELSVPAQQAPGTYSGTMVVAITANA